MLSAEQPGLSFQLPKGPLLGLGEGGPQFDRKGSMDRMRNGQGGYQLRTHGGRVPIQWLVATDGWGMFIHHPLGAFDFTGAEGTLTPSGDALPLDVFVVASQDPAVIVGEYARITGYAELPPLWAFGYMQSHRTLAGPEEVMWVARTFREKKLPCDALIYLGTEFTPSGWNTRNGEFSWKKENFPDPQKAIDDLHALHYKVVLHAVIEGRRMSGTVAGACTPDKAVPSGRTPDDRWPEDRAVECYWPYHKPVMDLGVDGWWPDQGDGLDGRSRLARIRMYWEGPQLYRRNERPFALHRNGYAGMQRYGAFLWSGDVYSTWETLKTHVPVAVNTGLSGIPLLGNRHRRLRADARIHRRAARPLVSVRHLLSLVPGARPNVAPQAAVGMEHRRVGPRRNSKLHRRGRESGSERAPKSRGSSRSSGSTSSSATGCCPTPTPSRRSAARPGCR